MRLAELARRIGGVAANGDLTLNRFAPLSIAGPGDLSFLSGRAAHKQLRFSCASAVIVDRDHATHCVGEPLIVENCMVACARAGQCLPSASRELDARTRPLQMYDRVDQEATIDATAAIGRAVAVGAHSRIGAHCVIGDGVRIGAYTEIGPYTQISAAANLGNRIRIGSHCHIGGEPFSFARDRDKWLRLPCFASVSVEDDATVANHCTIDRGRTRDTTIGSGTIIDSHVHIGHDTVLGMNVAIAAASAIAGETTVGKGVSIAGGVGIGEGLVIAERVRITAMSMVSKSVHLVGASYSSGWPARPSRQWWRFVAALSKATGLSRH